MTVSFEYEKGEDGKILAAYVRLSTEPVARTVEIEKGHCIVDESKDGAIVGVEFLLPENIGRYAEMVAKKYENPAIKESLLDIQNLVNA